MPRDLPTRRVFVSIFLQKMCLCLQVALCIVHTTKYYYVWSPTQKWRRSTTLFFYAGLYHTVHVPLHSLTCGTSSTCRVWHPSS